MTYFTETVKPRKIAQGLIQSFLQGEDTDLTLPAETAHYEAMAKTHARNMAALTIFHARRVEKDRSYKVPTPLWPSVRLYLKSRGRW